MKTTPTLIVPAVERRPRSVLSWLFVALALVLGLSRFDGAHAQSPTLPAQAKIARDLASGLVDAGKAKASWMRDLNGVRYVQAIVVSNANDALTRIRSGVAVDMLFTDIIMPGATDGWKLAELIKEIRPDIKVMYTTGYSDLSSERIRATKGIVLLEKPYRLSTLARMLRQALDEKPDVRKQATAPEAPQTRH